MVKMRHFSLLAVAHLSKSHLGALQLMVAARPRPRGSASRMPVISPRTPMGLLLYTTSEMSSKEGHDHYVREPHLLQDIVVLFGI